MLDGLPPPPLPVPRYEDPPAPRPVAPKAPPECLAQRQPPRVATPPREPPAPIVQPPPPEIPVEHAKGTLGADVFRMLWQVEERPGVWIDYEPDWSRRLEEAWNRAQTEYAASFMGRPRGTVEYEYDVWPNLFQRNTETGGKRRIRRIFIENTLFERVESLKESIDQHNAAAWDPSRAYERRNARAARSRSASLNRRRGQTPPRRGW